MVPNITFSQAIFSSGPRFELGVGAVLGTEFAADFVLASIIGLISVLPIFLQNRRPGFRSFGFVHSVECRIQL